jgi:hypothetical protein
MWIAGPHRIRRQLRHIVLDLTIEHFIHMQTRKTSVFFDDFRSDHF